ncbi:hypothetical protein [Nannocystis punicea]|uniref:Uncharacterized protein n=1 Tax=Nannocystis punicea TaxID=2995304 RepID=A0ABY7GYV3_9BACT|nr:hypothetical protein [Nannocystis poenicansa]WAS92137.1 hypothetical protein O0S08_38640 [Nannocystis poenicansa]
MSLWACGQPGGGASEGEADTEIDSTGDTTGGTDGTSGTTAPTTSGSEPSSSTSDSGIVVGEAKGLLNFTFYPETAGGLPAELGMAGAWRTEPFTTDDFFAVQAWGMHLPPPPEEANTVVNNSIPAPYDWGKDETWITGGNALKLRGAAGESLACLVLVQDTFPVYFSDDAEFFDPLCAPDPAKWVADDAYDVIAFGGEGKDDIVLPAAVTAPPALTVTAPDVATSLFEHDRATDLDIDWEANGGQANRVVIRLIDTYGQMLTAHAVDDGSFTIPSAELTKLAPGPATLTISREQSFDLGLPDGDLRVVLRYEVWADPDLI